VSGNQVSKPILSIVTPVFNGGDFIASALQSVREASKVCENVEHIIMDGGSTDNTLQIIEAERRIPGSPISQVISGQDGGQADAINRGFSLAKGSFLAWLNADDVYVSSSLCAIVQKLQQTRADVVLGRCVFVRPDGTVLFSPKPPDPVTPSSLLCLLSGWYAGRSIVQPEAFISREAFGSSGGLDDSLHYTMDHEFWLRLALRGAVFEQLDIVVAKQLVHAGQKTADNTAVVTEQLGYAANKVSDCSELFEPDLEQVQAELKLLNERLVSVKEINAALTRLDSGYEYRPPTIDGIDSRVFQELGTRSAKAQRWLCVGLNPAEVQAISREIHPLRPPVVVGGTVNLPGTFDVVAIRRPIDAPKNWRRIAAGNLREGGYLAVLGEPGPERVLALSQCISTEISNRLTWRSKYRSLSGAASIVRESRQRWQPICDSQMASGYLETVYTSYYGKPSDHPMLELANYLGIASEVLPWRSGIWRMGADTRT
jgi:GT2 family glycosyltransferase